MKKQLLLALLVCSLWSQPLASQGHLMLVGGGSEKNGGWSDAPYGWAVEKSANKRVAVITYDPEATNWIPDYFKDLGALEAKNFIIDDAVAADLQETYDSLVTYDVIFFKGGDQWKYYDYYRNTLTQQAVEDVFSSGGVIGGTSAGLAILSGVIFTAENGTVYPEEALEDPFNPYMTLEDDFLDLYPGYIFDSHFVERARFGRLLGFLGHWKIGHEEDIVGIGVDDKTAFCIDADSTGKAFGTGAVTLMMATENTNFHLSGAKLVGSSIITRQLLDGSTIDLTTHAITGMDMPVQPEHTTVTHMNELWLSGSDKLYDNAEMLTRFVLLSEPFQDTVVIVTGSNTSTAGFFRDYIEEELKAPTLMMQAIPATVQDPAWTERIGRLQKFLVVGNEYDTFMDFLYSWPNGNLLKDKVLDGEKQVAFVGDNSRFAGKTVLVNYEQEYASYDGLLEFDAGWGLLRNAIIMPKTFSGDIDNENAAAGVPYGMVLDQLHMGFWLHGDCYLHYWPTSNIAVLRSYGSFPMITLVSKGTTGGFSTQSAVNSGEPRDVAGFGEFELSLMDSSMMIALELTASVPEESTTPFHIWPNPATDRIRIQTASSFPAEVLVYDTNGQEVQRTCTRLPGTITLDGHKSGIYILRIRKEQTGELYHSKFIIQQQ